MAVSWGFAMLLVLTVVALITFGQPLFQSEAVAGQTHAGLELAPEGEIAREMVRQILETLEGGCSRQPMSARKLIHRDDHGTDQHKSRTVTRRSVLATFQSDRMVPTGPNPLHNSNRSQVIFP